MSRRFLFIILAFVVMLYFSIILFLLNPLHSARGFSSVSYPYRRVPVVDWCKPLQFRSPPGDVVALASYPGSGNTWLRYLLQQATGILTGSIYMDHGLRLHGFPAENITDGSVLVVKTHEQPPKQQDKIKSAILLIRNPRDAILADFNRLHMGHIGTAPKSAFKKKMGKVPPGKEKMFKKLEWSNYVFNQLVLWEVFNKDWLRKYKGPVHIVYYEILVRNTRRTLKDILHFLKYNINDTDLTCALANREGIYRRVKKHKDFDPFTLDMYSKLDAARTRVAELVRDYRNSRGNNIETDLRDIEVLKTKQKLTDMKIKLTFSRNVLV